MRVVFFGTPEFAVPSLTALCDAGVDVAAVVTQPDRPRGRSHSTLMPPPVKLRALAANIPVWQPERPRDEPFCTQLRALGADLGVVVAYGHLLRPELLAIPRFGFVNVHASLLPRWRGAAPIQWSLLSGDPETGVSIMRVETGLDTGAVWHARDTTISELDTAGTLTKRLAQLGAGALLEALPRIAGGAEPVPQDKVGVTHAPKITRDLARIRWNEPATVVSCRIRAMDPAPGAWTTIAGVDVKVFGARVRARPAVVSQHPAPLHGRAPVPGTVTDAGSAVIVITQDQSVVEIREVQPAGKRQMPAAEWLRGANLPSGARFT
jgi:methionyl-tRNA formyltransferase